MAARVFLILALIISLGSKCSGFDEEPIDSEISTCGPYEVLKDNPDDCVSDCCPVGDNAPCPGGCSTGPCKCSLMSRRAKNGTCISTRQCPPYPCGKHEVYDSCPNYCSEQCSNKSPDGRRCRSKFRIGITVICKPKCRCAPNYWRNDDGNCVAYSKCPKSQDEE